jgi:hypothetical protein
MALCSTKVSLSCLEAPARKLRRSQFVRDLLSVPQPDNDDSTIIIDLDYPSESINKLVASVYTPEIELGDLLLQRYVDLLRIADQLEMPGTEQKITTSICNHADRTALITTCDSVWQLLTYASQHNDLSLAQAAIKFLGHTSETVHSFLMAPKLKRLDSIPSRYMNALFRSVIKLGPSASWVQIARDLDVLDDAVSSISSLKHEIADGFAQAKKRKMSSACATIIKNRLVQINSKPGPPRAMW